MRRLAFARALIDDAPGLIFAPHSQLNRVFTFTESESGMRIATAEGIADPARLATLRLAVLEGGSSVPCRQRYRPLLLHQCNRLLIGTRCVRNSHHRRRSRRRLAANLRREECLRVRARRESTATPTAALPGRQP